MTEEDVRQVTESAKDILRTKEDVFSKHILAYISFLEKENAKLKNTLKDWDIWEEGRKKEIAELNRDKTELVNSVTELKAKVSELEKQIEKMKRCGNCSNFNNGNCKFSLKLKEDVTTFVKMHEDFFCINYDKWESAK